MSQQDKVVITRHGKPAAVLVGVEGKDWEDMALQTLPSFWKLIEERRKETTLSIKELRTGIVLLLPKRLMSIRLNDLNGSFDTWNLWNH